MTQVQQHSKEYLQPLKDKFVKEVLTVYTPNLQQSLCANPDKCFVGSYPTLSQLKKEFGNNAAVAWLIPQITDCVAFTNNKGILDDRQIENLAALIASEYYYLKVSEIMLFFRKFKLGKYREIYGNFSPMAITLSLNEFLNDRNLVYSRIEAAKGWQKRKEDDKGSITYEEYKRRKQNESNRSY